MMRTLLPLLVLGSMPMASEIEAVRAARRHPLELPPMDVPPPRPRPEPLPPLPPVHQKPERDTPADDARRAAAKAKRARKAAALAKALR